MARKNSKAEKLIIRAIEISAILAEAKLLYREFDSITLELIQHEFNNGIVEGHQIAIIDNFAEKNTAFRVARMNRYQLIIEKLHMPIMERRKLKVVTAKKAEKWDFPTKKKADKKKTVPKK